MSDDGSVRRAFRVELGRRVMVVSNLLLRPERTDVSAWAVKGLCQSLASWDGPGLLVVAGGLFDICEPPASKEERASDSPGVAGQVGKALEAHKELTTALQEFAASPQRHILYVTGNADALLGTCPEARSFVCGLGVEVLSSDLDLELETATGVRKVRIEGSNPNVPDSSALPAMGPVRGSRTIVAPATWAAREAPGAWMTGIDRLAEPAAAPRFVTSRMLYRRMARFAWLLLLPFVLVLLTRVPPVYGWLLNLPGHPLHHHTIERFREASWGTRLLFAGIACSVGIGFMGVVLTVLSRRAWSALTGGPLPRLFEDQVTEGATANDAARIEAGSLVQAQYTGLISGASLQAELTHLGSGFFASPGVLGAVVSEYPGRLGLPPVFLEHRQLSWVELETGADLHARLLLGSTDPQPGNLLERIAARHRLAHDTIPCVVALYPNGQSWPPAPDLSGLRSRSRRFRRIAATAIAVTGALDLLSALSPPIRDRLHLVLQFLPFGIAQAATALVALAGVGLLSLARGIRRGQQRSWRIAVGVLAVTLILHLVRGGDVEQSFLAGMVLALLVLTRREFSAASDQPSLRSAIVFLGGVIAAAVLGATAIVYMIVELRTSMHFHLTLWRAAQAVSERLIGLRSIALPRRIDAFLWPSMLAIGVTSAVVFAFLITRPVVDRKVSAGRFAEARARSIVMRHGEGSLDYFALRSDKKWFFYRDNLVAYAIYGGVCLVSPDPIGPNSERAQVWSAFRRFADSQGWTVAVMAASESWLPHYRASGMHDIYIGDEAIVDVQSFSLAGGEMKGLRQAYNRIAKYGYRASFHDPAHLDPQMTQQLAWLMTQSRRGEAERGFSMMLGRIFDPRDEGLLLTVVTGPDGRPAAMCQFVPSPAIAGYSLDLMRRDRGEHPNGLMDFALVSTIEELRRRGARGLSLNFAAMRSILDGERGDTTLLRIERWALKKMSSFLQIETLWRFNAKYKPSWLARYVVYDAAEHLVPVLLAIMRAESLWEIPVIGRVVAAAERRGQSDGAQQAPRSFGEGFNAGTELPPGQLTPGQEAARSTHRASV